jgi:hypothetical protein
MCFFEMHAKNEKIHANGKIIQPRNCCNADLGGRLKARFK